MPPQEVKSHVPRPEGDPAIYGSKPFASRSGPFEKGHNYADAGAQDS